MPTTSELRRHCEREGWEHYRETDHSYYRKVLDDGTVLRTKVSHGNKEIPKNIWRDILKRQLRTTIEHFNEVV